jgi:hypothetical protein
MFEGAWIPLWLLERHEVSAGAKLVYSILCRHSGQNGECFPGIARLAKELGFPISQEDSRSIRRHIQELVDFGLIEKEQIGLNKTNRYYFLKHEWMENKIRQGPADLAGPDRQVGEQDFRIGGFDRSGPADVADQDRTDLSDIKEQELKEKEEKKEIVVVDNNSKTSRQGKDEEEQGESQSLALSILLAQGVNEKVARKLAGDHSIDRIKESIELSQKKKRSNIPGFIVKCLTEGWSDFESDGPDSASVSALQRIPTDFHLTEKMYKFAKEKLVPYPAREFENFLNYYLAKGTKYSDWEKVWMHWVNRMEGEY